MTTTNMIARVPYDYAAATGGHPHPIAVIWEGTNDLAVGLVSATTCYNNLVTLANLLKAAGYYKVVMGTILPRGSTISSTFETARQTVNTAMCNNSLTNWDVLATWATTPR